MIIMIVLATRVHPYEDYRPLLRQAPLFDPRSPPFGLLRVRVGGLVRGKHVGLAAAAEETCGSPSLWARPLEILRR